MKHPALNPYLPGYEYVPDGEPRVFGDRLYVYGSHDYFGGVDFCPGDYVCWSAPVDALGDWRSEGVIYRKTQDPSNTEGKGNLFAPDCVQGPDGRYYLYYQVNSRPNTAVAVSDSPSGPFEYYGAVQHPDGTPWGMKEGDCFCFDPGVLIDDDGKIYLYVGFAATGKLREIMQQHGRLMEHAVCLQLLPDMITVEGEEKKILPGQYPAKGTPYEGHGFYEASSPRKIGGRYYFVYSSELSHELCYAVSDRPDGGYRYGGTIVSIGDLGYHGNTEALNYTGNTHGGLVQIGEQWYIFYHRQTNRQKCARQGCAEKIEFLPDGSIPQVEMTSCGLNGGPLAAKGRYEARIACNLQSREGTFAYLETREPDEKGIHPYFTQTQALRDEDCRQYIANFTDGALAAYKYFAFTGEESRIFLRLRGSAEGKVRFSTGRAGAPIAEVPIAPSEEFRDFSGALRPQKGTFALYLTIEGSGAFDLLEFAID